ncbi:MAG: CPXCG motif-containing cysteine-rich protein [Chromatiales bacterium]|nr:CPXCG motif-containing cysteine-rich protein [Chromatiales bacterium]
MIEWTTVTCPYCGENFDTSVDCSAGDQQYIEDCQVCCRPIAMQIEVDFDGGLLSLSVRREDE